MPFRQLEIIYDKNPPHFEPHSIHSKSAVLLFPENFGKAKNLLGQEFDHILYDARTALNLDALAMAVGTLRAGGKLTLYLNSAPHIDLDSQRWAGVEKGIATPNFNRHFERCLERLLTYSKQTKPTLIPTAFEFTPTVDQQKIINQILQFQWDLFIITAKRGRGKSALAGLLAQKIRSAFPEKRIFLTAPNKSAVQTLQDFSQEHIEFIAPDELIQQIQQDSHQFQQDWLLIDEASQLPLSSLEQLTSTFQHIALTTTIHSYEGTGRGFLLKFLANLHRSFQHFELTQPLRWAENDPLERFIDELLLIDCEDRLVQPEYNPKIQKTGVGICPISQQEIVEQIDDFYGLLTLAHYRTSPVDLRRLFDAPKQQFYKAEYQGNLLGGLWLMEEGGMVEQDLIEQICRGERRPKGNLVAQSLAFYYHFPQACELRSLRISRIAVQPNWQNQGIGQQLIHSLIEKAVVDFLSVSFGYTPELMRFWQKCGFILVQISDYKESSSGCYSAIAVKGISPQGKTLEQQLSQQFQRDIGLSFHPFATIFQQNEINWQLNDRDWLYLKNFADYHRTLLSSLPAIRRLLAISAPKDCPLLWEYCSGTRQNRQNQEKFGGKKSWLIACRKEVKILLRNV